MNTDRLKQFHSKYSTEAKLYVEAINDSNYDKRAILNSMISNNLYFATYSIFVDKNYDVARQCFHNCALITEYLHVFFDQSIYSSTRNFCYAVLSDNSRVIERHSKYEDTFLVTLGAHFGKAIQAIFTNENNKLKELIAALENDVRKKTWERYFAGAVDIFKGMLNMNSEAIENGINELVLHHAQQENPPVVREFLNVEATALAKLAWSRGIKANIESDLIPQEMLPSKELSNYQTYDFLSELN